MMIPVQRRARQHRRNTLPCYVLRSLLLISWQTGTIQLPIVLVEATATSSTPFNPYATTTWGTETLATIASQYKAPNKNTPAALVEEWARENQALWSYVAQQVPDVLEHTGSAAFDEHLKGVQAVLRFWNAPDHLAKAGLFHSIYGTEGFQGFALPLSQRSDIRELIGEAAEHMCFAFCMVDRWTLDETILAWTPDGTNQQQTFHLKSRPELGRFNITLSREQWLDFVELSLADWLEQVEGAAAKANPVFLWKVGQAYAYRRTSYQQMSRILAAERAPRLEEIPTSMLEAVMATESPDTVPFIQPRTPPMSKAAENALAALRAVGENIPENFAPRPIIQECETRMT